MRDNILRIKVLHIITSLSTGGAERALYNVLAGGLAQSGNVSVLSLTDEGTFGPRIRDLGVPVFSLDIRRGVPGPVPIQKLRKLVRDLQPEIIQGWMYHGNLAASLAAWLAPGRTAVAWNIRHSLYSLSREKPLTRLVIRAHKRLSTGVNAVVYNSSLSRRQHEAFSINPTPGRVIPNGFDTEAFKPKPESKPALLQYLGFPGNAVVVGHVARFHPMKDHPSFLRAAVEVARQVEEVRFLVVGRRVDLNNPALAGIVPSDLIDRFHFPGECQYIPTLMQAMDVMCASSAWGEAFPNVLGEAMASGVPCVATDVGDSSIIIGDTGIIVPPSDSSALAKGILSLLLKSQRDRFALGRAARFRIQSYYALSKVVEEYDRLYKDLTSNQSPLL